MSGTPGEDAAFPENISANFTGVIGGYFGGPNAYHVWPANSWLMFRKNPKLPIWVAGYDGETESADALSGLRVLGIPKGCPIGVDMEGRADKSYLDAFCPVLQRNGYLVIIYGSASTVFNNPQYNGYWVAEWTGTEHMAINPRTGDSLGIRGTQWASGPQYDSSEWKDWVVRKFWL